MSAELQTKFNQEAKIQDKIIEIIDTLRQDNEEHKPWNEQKSAKLAELTKQLEDPISFLENLKGRYEEAARRITFSSNEEPDAENNARSAISSLAYQHIIMD